MLRSKLSTRRSAAAAVEFAVVMPFVLMPLMFGLWEVGRLVQVQQIVSNAAREGARLAAQAKTINRTGNPTEIRASIAPSNNTNADPNVKATVMQSLAAAGLNMLSWSDVTVTFEFLDQPAGATVGPSTTDPQPSQAVKNQRFRVTVVIDYTKARWISLGMIPTTQVRDAVEWRSLVDDPFVVNPNMPTW
jgi:Flp pilus assembly protein TadG